MPATIYFLSFEAADAAARAIRKASDWSAFASPLLTSAGWIVARSLAEMNGEPAPARIAA